jgi:hypothetical protein
MTQSNGQPPHGARPREFWLVALTLAALLGAVIWGTGGVILFTRPLWVDEWFTVLVASHASPIDVIADLRHGADGGASLFHLLVWALRAVTGGLSPTLLHAMSLVSTWGALLFVYVVLRRRFSRDASIAGMLAAGANTLVVAYAFEGRFYALWVLCAAFFAWSLGLTTRRRSLVVAIAAILLTTSHWYGVISLAMMSAAVFVSYGRNWRDGLRCVVPGSAGLVAFLLISPLAAGQQAVLTVASWVPDFKIGQIGGLASTFWLAGIPIVAFGALIVAIMWRERSEFGPPVALATRTAVRDPSIVALFSLTLMPVALVALSLVGRPSMLARYALPAVLAWGPWVAFAMDLLGRWPARAFALALVVVWVRNFGAEARRKHAFTLGIEQNASLLRQAERLGVPIVFQSQHTMYPLEAATRGRGSLGVYLDLPDSTLDALFPATSRFYQLNKGIRLERDFARVQARLYGFPRLATQAALDTTARFVLFAPYERLPRGMNDINELGHAVFPHHRAVPLQENLLLLERVSARNPPARSTSR